MNDGKRIVIYDHQRGHSGASKFRSWKYVFKKLNMYKILFILLTVVILTSCNSATDKSGATASDSLGTNKKDNGWVQLFDGKTMNGWHTYGKDSVGKAWKIDSGALHLDASHKKK